jgi:hypothetical protein
MCRSRSSSEQRASLDRDGIADEDCLPTEKMSVTEPAQGRMRGRGMKKQTATRGCLYTSRHVKENDIQASNIACILLLECGPKTYNFPYN